MSLYHEPEVTLTTERTDRHGHVLESASYKTGMVYAKLLQGNAAQTYPETAWVERAGDTVMLGYRQFGEIVHMAIDFPLPRLADKQHRYLIAEITNSVHDLYAA